MVSFLPEGLRDYLPSRARRLRALDHHFLEYFERHGFQYIISPLFEKVETFERGLGIAGYGNSLNHDRQLFRALDPHRGDLVAFRPDIIPQIARVVATRLKDQILPHRFCYSGRVFRAKDERDALTQEVFQVGCELIGSKALWSDVEIASMMIGLLRSVGLKQFKLDLGHAGFIRSILAPIEENLDKETYQEFFDALKRKDVSQLESMSDRIFGTKARKKVVLALPHLFGGEEVFAEAEKLLKAASFSDSRKALKELRGCYKQLVQAGLEDFVAIDLGELFAFQYYSGIMMQGFSRACKEPLVNGGRYDHLLGQFGHALPATGFAINLEVILDILDHDAKVFEAQDTGVILFHAKGRQPKARLRELADLLGKRRVRTCYFPEGEKAAKLYAKQGGYQYVVEVPVSGSGKLSVVDLAVNKRKKMEDKVFVKSIKR